MVSNPNLGGNFWGYLINEDKSPALLLDQLCLGIAKFIATELEPKGVQELTPAKLASFYRAVGGNYDSMFLSTPNSSLSFIYQQLGCFHSLQPSDNAFEVPSLPALLPRGFVRWQTIQILLNPDDHFGYLQKAIQRYDIPSPAGGTPFPKILPRKAFPPIPDKEMIDWHNQIGERIEQESRGWRLKASPYQSPPDRPGGIPRVSSNDERMGESSDYFSRSSVRPPSSRATRPNYSNSQEFRNFQGRRCSAQDQDLISPTSRPNPTHYWPQVASQRRSQSPRRESSSPRNRHTSHSSSNGHSPPKAESSGSEASSEADSPKQQRKSTTWSHAHLFPPHLQTHHTRRHSHDATYSNNPPLPPRPQERKQSMYTHYSPPSSHPPQPRHSSVATKGVQFRDSFAVDRDLSDPGNPGVPRAPGSKKQQSAPIQVPVAAPPLANGWVKSADAINTSGGNSSLSEREKDVARSVAKKLGRSVRVNNVTSVGGRRHATDSEGPSAPEGWR